MHTVTLHIDRSCACCWKFRLVDAAGVIVWRNRTYPQPAGEQGARSRTAVWAEKHGYRIVEETPAAERRKAS